MKAVFVTASDKTRLDTLWNAHQKIRVCILGQPWQVRRDLEYKKSLIENEMRAIVSRYTGSDEH